MQSRRKGFTLIELLVVIAIIGILAAMLFPVFARARESARKTQCLSNVKNIAMAIQMYIADYEGWFPWDAGADAKAYFRNCNRAEKANPYLREPVILDEYVKSRDVWRCPSAKIMNGARYIMPIARNGYWLNGYLDNQSEWESGGGVQPCDWPFPSGWGGDVTDSWKQGTAATDYGNTYGSAGNGVFVAGIGVNDTPHYNGYSSIQDASRYVTVGDAGVFAEIWGRAQEAYPDISCTGLCGTSPGCCGTADPSKCPWSSNCGLTYAQKVQFNNDEAFRATKTRHMGGSNIGFFDGHAKWYPAEAIRNSKGAMDTTPDKPGEQSVLDGLQ